MIGSLVGLIILTIISFNIEPKRINFGDLDHIEEGVQFRSEGIVVGITKMGSSTVINFAQLENREIILFDSNLTFNKGDLIEVFGTLNEYDNEKRIIPDKIILK